ncbi:MULTISPECIES: hypothetical protein [Halobacteriovorax]|uniref:Uncharacterized protein n=1 Tax=Halobacteriovorax vibrionivorans TaxID=2152716 RepID=A0ABY0IC95_9BACT|nr:MULTISPECIES: hypothetical protein [Halobacteriovorax]AYF44514.1 hypothetical protein BALOs_1513 [Halobacteriovorax sp. BALOs_7]RZF20571.1 hypothetical protein DAY19_11335 [Halobacteriovorax vibrionivorans]TGD47484.1 hypothetical protein EP118_07865 [Halobacteriovorax sp. Y22]
MSKLPTLEEAIEIVRPLVKYSVVENQKHIDLSVATADKRMISQQALMVIKNSIDKGLVDQKEINTKLGLD